MSNKTKNTQTSTDKLVELSRQASLILMTAAVTFGMLELPEHPNSRVVVPAQPTFAFAPAESNSASNNSLRRESEETAPHYVSYSETQRTPSRSGRN